jgi:hypothetical protein
MNLLSAMVCKRLLPLTTESSHFACQLPTLRRWSDGRNWQYNITSMHRITGLGQLMSKNLPKCSRLSTVEDGAASGKDVDGLQGFDQQPSRTSSIIPPHDAKSHVSLHDTRHASTKSWARKRALQIISESVKYVKHLTESAEAMLAMGFTTFQSISYLSVSTSALEKEECR